MILTFAVVILAGGALSLFVLRRCSPNLQGVRWLAAAFAAGSLGAGMLLCHPLPLLSVVLADLALLCAFVLLHAAVSELTQASAPPWRGTVLVGVQAVVDGLVMAGVADVRYRIGCVSVLVAMQSALTSRILLRSARNHLRAPALYSAVLMAGFAVLNCVRAVLVVGGFGSTTFQDLLTLLSYSAYVLVALGFAFGFFWMTTAQVTSETEHMASTDPLTRVYNRRMFLRWCERELLRSQRSGVPFSLLMLDLDHFKCVNDNFGHQRGDEVLCASVERMQDSVRGIDVLCRWGGEEFAVLLPNAPEDATHIVAERIRENILRMRVPLARTEGADADWLTVSIGAATYRDLDDDIAAMLLRADRALYQAKHAGRNRVLVGT